MIDRKQAVNQNMAVATTRADMGVDVMQRAKTYLEAQTVDSLLQYFRLMLGGELLASLIGVEGPAEFICREIETRLPGTTRFSMYRDYDLSPLKLHVTKDVTVPFVETSVGPSIIGYLDLPNARLILTDRFNALPKDLKASIVIAFGQFGVWDAITNVHTSTLL